MTLKKLDLALDYVRSDLGNLVMDSLLLQRLTPKPRKDAVVSGLTGDAGGVRDGHNAPLSPQCIKERAEQVRRLEEASIVTTARRWCQQQLG